jgi:hypothetical protein
VGVLVALHADVAHAHVGQDVEHPFHHAEPRAQDGRDDDGAREGGTFVGHERGANVGRAGLEVAGGFEGEQGGEFGEPGAKFLGGRPFIAQARELHAHERMFDDSDARWKRGHAGPSVHVVGTMARTGLRDERRRTSGVRQLVPRSRTPDVLRRSIPHRHSHRSPSFSPLETSKCPCSVAE